MQIARKTTSKHFRELIEKSYPSLSQNKAYWLFMAYLMFGLRKEEETGYLMIPSEIIASIENKLNQFRSRNYKAEIFLQKFKKEVYEFEYSDWGLKRVRVVTRLEWPPEITEAIERERQREWKHTGRVYFADGKPFSKRKQRKFRETDRQRAFRLMRYAQCKEAADLLEYVNDLPTNPFTKLLNDIHEAIKVANTIPDKDHQLNLLNDLYDQCQPLYKPTGASTRIYPLYENLASLEKNVRRALTKDWIECDLQHAQLAISTMLWRLNKVEQFLRTGENFWQYLADHCRIQNSAENKKLLKNGFYALMYGASKRTIIRELGGLGCYKLFFSNPIISEIWKARKSQLDKIKKDGGAENCFGQLLSTKAFSSRSILAQLSQAYELKILYPVVQLAKENRGKRGFTIALWQHDGFSFYPHHKQDKKFWTEKIKQIVAKEAGKYGIFTELDTSVKSSKK